MQNIEKIKDHHYKYQGKIIVLAEGTYDPDEPANLLTRLKNICEEIENQTESNV